MARSMHRLKVKSGGRTVATKEIAVDPKDHADLADAVDAILKAAHQSGASRISVEIYKGSKYLKEVSIR